METSCYIPNIKNVTIINNPTLIYSTFIVEVEVDEVLKSIYEYIDEISIGDEIGVI